MLAAAVAPTAPPAMAPPSNAVVLADPEQLMDASSLRRTCPICLVVESRHRGGVLCARCRSAGYDQVQRFHRACGESPRAQPALFRRDVVANMRRSTKCVDCPYHQRAPGALEHRCARLHPASSCLAAPGEHDELHGEMCRYCRVLLFADFCERSPQTWSRTDTRPPRRVGAAGDEDFDFDHHDDNCGGAAADAFTGRGCSAPSFGVYPGGGFMLAPGATAAAGGAYLMPYPAPSVPAMHPTSGYLYAGATGGPIRPSKGASLPGLRGPPPLLQVYNYCELPDGAIMLGRPLFPLEAAPAHASALLAQAMPPMAPPMMMMPMPVPMMVPQLPKTAAPSPFDARPCVPSAPGLSAIAAAAELMAC